MAISQTNANPIIFAAAGDKIDRKLFVRKIVLAGNTASAALTITDYASSCYLFNETVGTSATVQKPLILDFNGYPRGLPVSGIKCGAIPTGGTVFVYLG